MKLWILSISNPLSPHVQIFVSMSDVKIFVFSYQRDRIPNDDYDNFILAGNCLYCASEHASNHWEEHTMELWNPKSVTKALVALLGFIL